MECFAFGGAIVRFASLETSFHAANHTIPPPPSTRAFHFAPRIKTARRFTAKNPWWKSELLEKSGIKSSNLPKRFCMVGTRYFAFASNDWYSIWYYSSGQPWSITSLLGLVFRRRRVVFILLAMPPTSRGGRRWCCGVADSSLCLKSDMPQH